MKVYFSRMNILNNICTENERNTIILFPMTKLYTELSWDAVFNKYIERLYRKSDEIFMKKEC